MSFEWYRSLDEIIGPFENLVEIDRSRLLGADFEPRLSRWSLGGDPEYWEWDSISDKATSGRSPVAQKAEYHELETKDPETVSLTISQALLLPGAPSDYHFALLGAYTNLWQMRRQDPTINKKVEHLCLLDVRLVEAKPKAVQLGDDSDSFVHIPTFRHLISLYREEGYLAEAIEIAEKAEPFGGCYDLEKLRECMAALEAEDA